MHPWAVKASAHAPGLWTAGLWWAWAAARALAMLPVQGRHSRWSCCSRRSSRAAQLQLAWGQRKRAAACCASCARGTQERGWCTAGACRRGSHWHAPVRTHGDAPCGAGQNKATAGRKGMSHGTSRTWGQPLRNTGNVCTKDAMAAARLPKHQQAQAQGTRGLHGTCPEGHIAAGSRTGNLGPGCTRMAAGTLTGCSGPARRRPCPASWRQRGLAPCPIQSTSRSLWACADKPLSAPPGTARSRP